MMNPINPSGAPNPSPNIWPPPPTGANPYEQEQENTSGQNTFVPPQIAALKWNWGAFLLSFLWAASHKISWAWSIFLLGLLSRIPTFGLLFSLISFGISIYLGLNGHKLGWQNRRFDGGLPQYFAVQQKWLVWGVGVLVVFGLIGLALGIAGGLSSARHSP